MMAFDADDDRNLRSSTSKSFAGFCTLLSNGAGGLTELCLITFQRINLLGLESSKLTLADAITIE